MALNYLLDTNIILYHLGGRLKNPLPHGKFIISFVSEIELLSFAELNEKEEEIIRAFITNTPIIGITEEIKATTISLRKHRRMKTPDALIAATAINFDCCLLTNDVHFKNIPGLRSKSLPIKENKSVSESAKTYKAETPKNKLKR